MRKNVVGHHQQKNGQRLEEVNSVYESSDNRLKIHEHFSININYCSPSMINSSRQRSWQFYRNNNTMLQIYEEAHHKQVCMLEQSLHRFALPSTVIEDYSIEKFFVLGLNK